MSLSVLNKLRTIKGRFASSVSLCAGTYLHHITLTNKNIVYMEKAFYTLWAIRS